MFSAGIDFPCEILVKETASNQGFMPFYWDHRVLLKSVRTVSTYKLFLYEQEYSK